MVAKLKIALVLLIIGSFSGLAIVGVQNLTEGRIEENRTRAQYEDYVNIFPELADVEEEDIEDDDVLDKEFTILDSDGNELGVIYRGTTSNDHGDVTTMVGIEDDTIKEVVISDHSNTPNYANIIIEDYLDPFSDQEVTDVSYDSDTGATQTYNSVRDVVDAATAQAQGGDVEDPEKDAYASLLEDTDDYEGYLEYDGFEFEDENSILDSDGEVIAHGFLLEIEDEDVRLLFDSDATFLGAVAPSDDPSDEVSDLLSDLNEFSDEPIGDIDASEVPDAFETAFDELNDFLTDFERFNDGRIREEEITDDSDDLEGYQYTAFYPGYSGTANELSVEVNTDGEVVETELLNHTDTSEYVEDNVTPNLDHYDGDTLEDLEDAEGSDAFSGASGTGGSVVDAITSALQYLDSDGEGQDGEEEGDPEEEAYASLLEDTDDYEGYLEYDGFEFEDENSILDSDGEVIAHGFLLEIEDEDVRLLFDSDTTFVGAVSLADDPSSEVSDLLSDLNEFSDEPIGDIDTSAIPGAFETAFEELDPFIRDYERMNDGRVKEEELKNDSDELEGFDYTAFYPGYSGTANELSVEVNTDGEVVETELLNHNDTSEYVEDNVTPNLDHYDGDTLEDLEDAEGSDAFSGASGTGGSVVDAITSALELHDRRAKYAEIFDEASSVEREYVQGYDTLVRQITVSDDSGDELGVIYEGEQVNSVGPLTVYVGIEGDTLKAVTLPYHENTGEYVDPLMEDYVEPLAGTPLDDVSYDSDTGATVTYNSIQDAIDEAIEAENERTGD